MAPQGMERGILIALEGIDGAGKSTQVRLLAERLRDAALTVHTTREPTDGPWGRKIRQSAIEGRMSLEDEYQAFLHDRREHVETLIAPALTAGEVVITDRYYFSTAAYQGARGMDPAQIIAENEAFAPSPDLLVVLELDVTDGLARVDHRGQGSDEFEHADALARCAAIFAALDRPELVRLDARQDPEAVHRQLIAALIDGPLLERAQDDGPGSTAQRALDALRAWLATA